MKQVAFVSLIVVAAAAGSRNVEQTNIFDVDGGSDNPVNRFDINFEEPEAEDSEPSSITTVSTSRTGNTLSCKDGSETLIAQEDMRWELQYINVNYLENASIEKVCVPSADGTNCNFDFGLFPNNLNEVCKKYGGIYEEREHSIQCHNPTTKEQLYYQIDRFPNCFPTSCQRTEVNSMVEHQIESVRRALEEDSGMICYTDYDILRHAGEYENSGGMGRKTSWVMSLVTVMAMTLYYL
jgi:hypothetical protein